jgi:hypothetical protein
VRKKNACVVLVAFFACLALGCVTFVMLATRVPMGPRAVTFDARAGEEFFTPSNIDLRIENHSWIMVHGFGLNTRHVGPYTEDVLTVEFTVANRSDTAFRQECTVRDRDGRTYERAWDLFILQSAIPPGESRRVRVDSNVPRTDRSLILHCSKTLEVEIQ